MEQGIDGKQATNGRGASKSPATPDREWKQGEAFENQPPPRALNPKWWDILAPLPWWLRWSLTILAFVVGTMIGIVVTSLIYVRINPP
jgi:hypothetical protein